MYFSSPYDESSSIALFGVD